MIMLFIIYISHRNQWRKLSENFYTDYDATIYIFVGMLRHSTLVKDSVFYLIVAYLLHAILLQSFSDN